MLYPQPTMYPVDLTSQLAGQMSDLADFNWQQRERRNQDLAQQLGLSTQALTNQALDRQQAFLELVRPLQYQQKQLGLQEAKTTSPYRTGQELSPVVLGGVQAQMLGNYFSGKSNWLDPSYFDADKVAQYQQMKQKHGEAAMAALNEWTQSGTISDPDMASELWNDPNFRYVLPYIRGVQGGQLGIKREEVRQQGGQVREQIRQQGGQVREQIRQQGGLDQQSIKQQGGLGRALVAFYGRIAAAQEKQASGDRRTLISDTKGLINEIQNLGKLPPEIIGTIGPLLDEQLNGLRGRYARIGAPQTPPQQSIAAANDALAQMSMLVRALAPLYPGASTSGAGPQGSQPPQAAPVPADGGTLAAPPGPQMGQAARSQFVSPPPAPERVGVNPQTGEPIMATRIAPSPIPRGLQSALGNQGYLPSPTGPAGPFMTPSGTFPPGAPPARMPTVPPSTGAPPAPMPTVPPSTGAPPAPMPEVTRTPTPTPTLPQPWKQRQEDRKRLIDAIDEVHAAGYSFPSGIGTPNEQTGDRAASKDIEQLIAALGEWEIDERKAGEVGKADEIRRKQEYWKKDLRDFGMTQAEADALESGLPATPVAAGPSMAGAGGPLSSGGAGAGLGGPLPPTAVGGVRRLGGTGRILGAGEDDQGRLIPNVNLPPESPETWMSRRPLTPQQVGLRTDGDGNAIYETDDRDAEIVKPYKTPFGNLLTIRGKNYIDRDNQFYAVTQDTANSIVNSLPKFGRAGSATGPAMQEVFNYQNQNFGTLAQRRATAGQYDTPGTVTMPGGFVRVAPPGAAAGLNPPGKYSAYQTNAPEYRQHVEDQTNALDAMQKAATTLGKKDISQTDLDSLWIDLGYNVFAPSSGATPGQRIATPTKEEIINEWNKRSIALGMGPLPSPSGPEMASTAPPPASPNALGLGMGGGIAGMLNRKAAADQAARDQAAKAKAAGSEDKLHQAGMKVRKNRMAIIAAAGGTEEEQKAAGRKVYEGWTRRPWPTDVDENTDVTPTTYDSGPIAAQIAAAKLQLRSALVRSRSKVLAEAKQGKIDVQRITDQITALAQLKALAEKGKYNPIAPLEPSTDEGADEEE